MVHIKQYTCEGIWGIVTFMVQINFFLYLKEFEELFLLREKNKAETIYIWRLSKICYFKGNNIKQYIYNYTFESIFFGMWLNEFSVTTVRLGFNTIIEWRWSILWMSLYRYMYYGVKQKEVYFNGWFHLALVRTSCR